MRQSPIGTFYSGLVLSSLRLTWDGFFTLFTFGEVIYIRGAKIGTYNHIILINISHIASVFACAFRVLIIRAFVLLTRNPLATSG